jgi:hypothetical protein
MYESMYNIPLTDYSIEGIMLYTTPLYNLGGSIFGLITGNMMIVALELIEVLTAIVDVTINIFGWLANQLGNLINGVVAWLESLGIDLSGSEVPQGCVLINGRIECL